MVSGFDLEKSGNTGHWSGYIAKIFFGTKKNSTNKTWDLAIMVLLRSGTTLVPSLVPTSV